MMSLREYRSKAANLPDFLPWAALVGEGVVLNLSLIHISEPTRH